SGQGIEYGTNISGDLYILLQEADKYREKYEDTYLSLEHVVLAAYIKNEIIKKNIDKKSNLEKLEKLILTIRGGKKIMTQNPENTYEVLEKYGRNLVALV
ncbi:ATP-dependent chaperone ClpB, partial [Streptococcus danieliae]|nr:ATP-dependent chaperone ClpB [Streptococcus danieliae]